MKKVRNLMQVLCVLLVTMTMTNCQNDNITEIQEEAIAQKEFPYTSSLIAKHEMEANSKLSMQMRSLATLQSNSMAEGVYNTTYGFTIDTEVANFVESTTNNSHSYTFPISRDNNTNSALENIVFSYNVTTDDYDASLVTYHFTASQLQDFLLTQHVNTPHEITYEPIAVNLSDILGENLLPCTTTYSVYHIIPDALPNAQDTFLYSTNGFIQNACQHEDGDDPCETFTLIDIYCPNSDGGSPSPNDASQNPYNSPNNTASGGSTTTNDADVPPNNDTDDAVDNIITSPISRQEVQTAVAELDNLLGAQNWQFTEDNEVMNFDSMEDLENFIAEFEDSFTTENSEIVVNQDDTITTMFRGQFGNMMFVPVYINVHVTCIPDNPTTTNVNELIIEEVTSFDSGLLPAVDWEQSSYQRTTSGATTTVVVRGVFHFGIKLPYLKHLSYTEQWEITVTFNNQTGEAIDIIADKLY